MIVTKTVRHCWKHPDLGPDDLVQMVWIRTDSLGNHVKGYTENIGNYAPMGESGHQWDFNWFSHDQQAQERPHYLSDGGVFALVGWLKPWASRVLMGSTEQWMEINISRIVEYSCTILTIRQFTTIMTFTIFRIRKQQWIQLMECIFPTWQVFLSFISSGSSGLNQLKSWKILNAQ